MKTNYFSRKIRQFRNLSHKVNHLIHSGEWGNLSEETRRWLILKLNLMFRELSCFFSQLELKKILAAAAIFIGFPLAMQSQVFAPPQLNPFGLVPDSASLAAPDFADIDHDGDFDLFTGNYGGAIQFYKNNGSNSAPAFDLPQQNPFGILTPLGEYHIAFPAFADIDHDGDLDLFIGGIAIDQAGNAEIQFYENTGTDSNPAFSAPLANPFGLEQAYMFVMPEFADIDNDGDFDLFTGEGYGNIKFYENTGSITEASFAAPLQNPFGLTPLNIMGSPAFADIDHDGDLDLFAGELYGNMKYFENTGSETLPVFEPPVTNPFGLAATNYYNFPAIADLDNDGDLDIMVGEYYSSMQYFKNTEFNIGIPENPQEAFFDIYPNPATDGFYVRLNNENNNGTWQVLITDLAGKAIKTGIINTDDLRLTADDLKPGVYFVRLIRDDKVYTRKLIVR